MKKEPRWFQKEAIKAVMLALKDGETPYLDLMCGLGKSFIMAVLTDKGMTQGLRVLQLVPGQELVVQNFNELMQYRGNKSGLGIVSAALGKKEGHAQAVVAMINSFVSKRFDFGKFDVLIIDECFSGETLISTPNGMKRIDKVTKGDIVYNATGEGVVSAVSKRKHIQTISIRLSNGKQIKTTNNHPIFTERGWINADKLEKGEVLFSIQDVRKLRKTVSSLAINRTDKKDGLKALARGGNRTERKLIQRDSFLLNKLLETERTQYKNSWRYRKDVRDIEAYWSQANNKRWQWSRINKSTKNNDVNTWSKLDCRTSNKNLRWTPQRYISELLQSGYRQQGIKNSYRIGRRLSSWETIRTRQEKRLISCFIRVESVQIEECQGGKYMYNLSVSGHPSYYAGGVLVHNCDLVTPDSKSMYQKVIAHLKQLNPNLKIIGLTGSPYRMGIGAIENDSIYGKATFTKCVWSSTDHIHRLIEEGYLSRIESISSDIHADMDRVRVNSNGDYDTELMSVKFDEIISHAVPDMIDKFNHYGIKTALIFASSIANSKRIIAEYKAITGLDNMRLVHGEMDKTEREKILKWLKNDPGNRYIVNVGILTRGYNYPQLDCVVFMRATKSLQLYIQCVGRAIRSHDEKECGYVIDYGTNIERLGPIDDITPPKPKQERGESPKKQCTAKIDNRAGITKIIKEIEHKRKYGDDCNYPNILSAKNCALCGAEFIPDEESPGNYSMRTKAEILRMKKESKYVKHDIKYLYFEPKISKSGHLMALMNMVNFDNITVHTVFLCLEHPGQAQGLAHRFIKSWLKNPAHLDELKQDGLNVENFLLLVQDDAILSRYFKKIKSITIEPQGSITNLVEIEYAI